MQLFPHCKSSKPYKGTLLGNLLVGSLDRRARNVLVKCVSGEHFASDIRNPLFKCSKGCPLCQHTSRKLSHFVAECSVFDGKLVAPSIGSVLGGRGVTAAVATAFLLTADESVLPMNVHLTLQQKMYIINRSALFLKHIYLHFESISHTKSHTAQLDFVGSSPVDC